MARKSSDKTYSIVDKKTGLYLVSYEMGARWRFHAFIGDRWASEALAKEALENGLKSKAIPKGDYLIQ